LCGAGADAADDAELRSCARPTSSGVQEAGAALDALRSRALSSSATESGCAWKPETNAAANVGFDVARVRAEELKGDVSSA
jgi:hypothetical protein